MTFEHDSTDDENEFTVTRDYDGEDLRISASANWSNTNQTAHIDSDHVSEVRVDGEVVWQRDDDTAEVDLGHGNVIVHCTDGENRTCCPCRIETNDITPDGRVKWPPSGDCP